MTSVISRFFFSVQEDGRAEWHFHNAERHKRKSARSKFKSKFRYPLCGSALGTGKSGYVVALTVFLARDVPQEVFYIIAGIPDTMVLKRTASTLCTPSLPKRTDPTGKLPNQLLLHRYFRDLQADSTHSRIRYLPAQCIC